MATLGELAKLVGGELIGDPNLVIDGVTGIEDTRPGTITLVASAKLLANARDSQASAFIMPLSLPEIQRPCIRVSNPRLAFATVLGYFAPKVRQKQGVDPTAIIGSDFHCGKDVSIGPLVVIGDSVTLGDHVTIMPGAVIGNEVVIGEGSEIHPNVVIEYRTAIGNRVIIHSGTVIGSDGFGYETVDGKHRKTPQIGKVVIEDDVEIGANVAIDRATVGVTLVKRGTKMDNLIQIGHNVVLGEDDILCGMCGIAGSAHLGDHVTVAGQAGVVGHIEVGSDSIVMARGLVINNLPANSIVSGGPARPHSDDMRIQAAAGKLPEMLKIVRDLQKRVADLESNVRL